MADKYQSEVSRLLHNHNVFTRHERALPVIRGQRVVGWNTLQRNSPDLTGGLVHQINIEVKTGGESFAFDKITEGQYAYAEQYREVRGCEFWFAIFFDLPYPVHGRLKRALFIIPYPELSFAINMLEGIQKSIPYRNKKGLKKQVVEYGLFANKLWKQFELEYNPQRKWYFLEDHPFSCMYFNQKPHLYKICQTRSNHVLQEANNL